MATVQNEISTTLLAAAVRGVLAGSVSASLYPPLDDVSWGVAPPSVTVADGPMGTTARRSVAGVPFQLEQNTYFQIDRTRTYRVRFWARASATANGTFYFALRQYLANGSVGPGNSGLEPYKPGAAIPSSAQTWQPYSFTWSSADWQVGVTQVRPLFLLNFNGTAGYWEIQDFQMQDVTEVVAAQTAATLAIAKYDSISNDGVLDRSEKAQVFLDWQAIEGEFTGLLNKAADLGVPSAAYLAALNALADYLSLLSPAWNNTALDTSIDRTVFNAKWTGYYNAKAALLTAIYVKAAGAPLAVIGGRNLHPDSGFERGTHPCTDKSNAVSNSIVGNVIVVDAGVYAGTKALFIDTAGGDAYVYIGGPKTAVVAGRQYMLSFMYKTATNGTITGSSTFIRYNNDFNLAMTLPVLNTASVWTVCEMPWTCPSGVTSIEFRFGIGSTGYSWINVDCIQVEEGNKRTQWMPSPDDVAADTALAAMTATSTAPPGGNIIPQNTLPTSTAGFTAGSSSGAYVWEGPLYDSTSYWAGGGPGGCVFTHVPNVAPAVNSYIDCYKDEPTKHPVVAGRRYEFGINISCHRCKGYAVVIWYNSSLTYIGETSGNILENNGASVVTNPTDFPRSFGFAVAPPGAAFAFLKGMQKHNGESDPYVFYSKWYIGEAGATQTVPSKWSEGGAGLSATAAAAKLAADTAATQAALANTRYDNMSADGILDRSEKAQVVLDWATIVGEGPDIQAKADSLGVSRVPYDNAGYALNVYLNALSPAWNDTSQDTGVVRATFNSMFTSYYNAKSALLNAISAKAATLANQLVTVDLGSGTHFGARNRNDHPSEYPVGTARQFKQADTFAFTSVSNYFVLETVKQYIDNSGGGLYQYAYVDSKTYRRYTASATGSNTSFTAWVLDLDRNSYTGDLNATVGAPSGTNVAGVLADTLVNQASTGAAAAVVVNNPPVLAAMGGVSASGVYKPAVVIATKTASITGGVGPFTVTWSIIPGIDGDTEITYVYSTVTHTNDRMTIRALCLNAGGSESTSDITCTITDSKGRFSSTQFNVSASG